MQIVNNWVKCKQSSVKWATTVYNEFTKSICNSSQHQTIHHGAFLGSSVHSWCCLLQCF